MIAYTVIEYVNAGISKGGSDPALPPPTLFRFAQQWTHYVCPLWKGCWIKNCNYSKLSLKSVLC